MAMTEMYPGHFADLRLYMYLRHYGFLRWFDGRVRCGCGKIHAIDPSAGCRWTDLMIDMGSCR